MARQEASNTVSSGTTRLTNALMDTPLSAYTAAGVIATISASTTPGLWLTTWPAVRADQRNARRGLAHPLLTAPDYCGLALKQPANRAQRRRRKVVETLLVVKLQTHRAAHDMAPDTRGQGWAWRQQHAARTLGWRCTFGQIHAAILGGAHMSESFNTPPRTASDTAIRKAIKLRTHTPSIAIHPAPCTPSS